MYVILQLLDRRSYVAGSQVATPPHRLSHNIPGPISGYISYKTADHASRNVGAPCKYKVGYKNSLIIFFLFVVVFVEKLFSFSPHLTHSLTYFLSRIFRSNTFPYTYTHTHIHTNTQTLPYTHKYTHALPYTHTNTKKTNPQSLKESYK